MSIFSKQNVDLITFNSISEKNLFLVLALLWIKNVPSEKSVHVAIRYCQAEIWWQEIFMKFHQKQNKKFHFLQDFLPIFMHHTNLWPSCVVIPKGVCVIDCCAAISDKVWSLGTLRWWQNQEYHRKEKLSELIHINQGRKRIYGALVVAVGRCSTTQEKQSTSLITFD